MSNDRTPDQASFRHRRAVERDLREQLRQAQMVGNSRAFDDGARRERERIAARLRERAKQLRDCAPVALNEHAANELEALADEVTHGM